MGLVKRRKKEFLVEDIEAFKQKAWTWSSQFEYSTILENNAITYPNDPFVNVLAVGARECLEDPMENSFEALKKFHKRHRDWCFGYFSYDLKNEVEALSSLNFDFQEFHKILFFIPEHIIFFQDASVVVLTYDDPANIFSEISLIKHEPSSVSDTIAEQNFDSISREEYIGTIQKIRQHLVNGDIYEINYCIEFRKEEAIIQPLDVFRKLLSASPMPFSSFLKADHQHIICSSPERFLKLSDSQLVSQPIKGTIKRGKTPLEDEQLKAYLQNSEKEISENMMIVDLVRNDLAKSATIGSIEVLELFKVYTFKQLHQMISTVSAQKRKNVHPIDAIKNAFPMGSMTGAPKIRAMQLIEKYERARRGAFSGAAGYITPAGDFDLNVLIRTIFFNSQSHRLSFQVGSAITYDADAQAEYDECMLKAAAILQILTNC